MPGALRSADRGTDGRSTGSLERDDWAAVTSERGDRHGRDRAPRRRAGHPARGHRRHALRRRAAPARALPRRSGRAVGRGARVLRHGARRAGARRVLQVLHGRGVLGAGAARTGRSRTRVGARPPTASARTWRRARDDVEDHWPPIADHWAGYGLAETVAFPERGRAPLTEAELAYARRQAELFGGQARWVQQRFGPWGGVVRGSPRAPRRRLRRDRRGLHRPVAHRAGRPAARRPASSRSPNARRASPGSPCARSPTARTPLAPAARRASRAPGSATARRAWTTSSTRWPGCCGPSRSWRRRARPRRRRRRAVGLAVGHRAAAGAQPGPGRVRDPARGAVAARGRAAWRDRRSDRRRSPSASPRPSATRCSTRSTSARPRSAPPPASWPCWRAPPTCSGDRPRPNRRSPAAALRWSRSRSRSWPGRPCWSWRWAPAPSTACSSCVGAMAIGVALMTLLAVRCPVDGPGGRVLRWAGRVLAAGLVAAGVLLGDRRDPRRVRAAVHRTARSRSTSTRRRSLPVSDFGSSSISSIAPRRL